MNRKEKISLEHVSAIRHPEYYRGERPVVTAADVPDDHWTHVEREDYGVMAQYNGLLGLMAAGELIRNVRIYRSMDEPQWRDITPTS